MKTNYSISRAPSGIFYLWYYDSRGKRQKMSTGCRLKAAAKQFAVKFLKGEIKASRARRNDRTVAEFMAEYLKHAKAQAKHKTYLDKRSCFNEFLKWLKNDRLPLREVSVKMVQDFIDYKQTTTSSATARRIYTGMCAAFHSANVWGYIETNPWQSVKKPRLVERHPLWITVDEFGKLTIALAKYAAYDGTILVDENGKLRYGETLSRRKEESLENRFTVGLMVIVAFNTGLRSGELRNLKFDAIDLPGRQLMVKNTETFTTKGQRERPVPLSNWCVGILRQRFQEMKNPDDLVFPLLLNGEKRLMSESYFSHEFKKVVKLAGLSPALRVHDLRHSFASNLVKAGTPLFHVAKLLGHRDVKTTQIYAHLTVDDLKDSVNILAPWEFPGPETDEGRISSSEKSELHGRGIKKV